MPIVTLKSTAYDSIVANVPKIVDPIMNRAQLRRAFGSVANAASDSSGSVYRLWRMPARAILTPETMIDLRSWGYADAKVGVALPDGAVLDDDGVLASTTIAGLPSWSSPIAAFGAKWGKPLWEAAGLAADPGEMLDVVIQSAANATGAGSVKFDATWMIG